MLSFHIVVAVIFVCSAALSLLFRNWRYGAHAASVSMLAAGATVGSGLWLLLSTETTLSSACIRSSVLIAVLALAATIRREYTRA